MPDLQFDEPTLRSLWIVLSLMAALALGWWLMASHDAAVRRHRRTSGRADAGRPPLKATLSEAARRVAWLWSRDLPMPWSGRHRRAAAAASARRGGPGHAASRSAGPATRSGRASVLPSSLGPLTAPALSADEVRADENRSRVQQEFEQMRQAQRAQFDKARQARAAASTPPAATAALSSAFADTAHMPQRAAAAHQPASGFVRLDIDDAQAQTLVHAFAPTAPMDEDANARQPATQAAPDPAALARAGFQPLA